MCPNIVYELFSTMLVIFLSIVFGVMVGFIIKYFNSKNNIKNLLSDKYKQLSLLDNQDINRLSELSKLFENFSLNEKENDKIDEKQDDIDDDEKKGIIFSTPKLFFFFNH